MRGRQKNTVMAVGGLIAVPIMWIILFSGQGTDRARPCIGHLLVV